MGEINNQCFLGAETQCGADAVEAASSSPEVALRSLPETIQASTATAYASELAPSETESVETGSFLYVKSTCPRLCLVWDH